MKVGRPVGPFPLTIDPATLDAFGTALGPPVAAAGARQPIVLGGLVVARLARALTAGDDEVVDARHVEQAVSVVDDVPCNVALEVTGEVVGVGALGNGEGVDVAAEVRAGERLVARTRSLVLFVGRMSSSTLRHRRLRVRQHGAPPIGSSEIVVRPETVDGYALASGDRNPIHLDDAAARAAGLPGRVAHGMCTLGLVQAAASRLAGFEGRQPASLEARFMAPVPVGAALAVRFFAGDDRCAFTASVPDPASGAEVTAAIGYVHPPMPLSSQEPPWKSQRSSTA